MNDVLQSIKDHLDGRGITYRCLHHQPTSTSQESADARGEDVRIGGKALLIKAGGRFCLFVLSAALKIDSAAIKTRLAVKKMRFATAEELQAQTGLVPGAVPPFAKPFFDFDLYVDESILRNDKIAFNAGSRTDSIVMSVSDYMAVTQPTVFRFSKQP